MNAVSVHRDLGEGRVGRGGVAVVVRAEVVGIVSMVCRLNLLQVAPILTGFQIIIWKHATFL